MINRDLKKRWCVTNIRARLNKIWTKRKKLTYKVLVVALKKKLKTFYHFFPDFISIFQTFSTSGKLLSKFQDFFKNSRLCANPESEKRENWPWKTGAPYPSSQQYFPTHRCAKATLYIPRLFPGFLTISDQDGYLSKLACEANVSARVRREHWDESQKKE